MKSFLFFVIILFTFTGCLQTGYNPPSYIISETEAPPEVTPQ